MRYWAMTVCVSCLIAGILTILLPKKEYEKSIKTVLALYILVSVLPAGSWDVQEVWEWSLPDSLAPADYSAYVEQMEQDSLVDQIQQLIHSNGLSSTVKATGENPLVLTVQAEPQEQEATLSLVKQAVQGMDFVEIVVEEEENES